MGTSELDNCDGGTGDLGVILVHGGLHGGWCWDNLRRELTFPSVAVDLPGRGASSEQLLSITLEDWVSSAAAQASDLDAGRLILVGHSLGGLTLPGLAAALGDCVHAMVFVAALGPAEGQTVAQLLNPADPGAVLDAGGLFPVPPFEVACYMLGLEDLPPDEIDPWLRRLAPEPPLPITTPVDRSGMPRVRTIYVRGERDVAVGPELAAQIIHNLGNEIEEVVVSAGHNMIATHPRLIARIVEGAAEVNARPQIA
ncbi:alpha/beta fold hydrolase [Nocardia anaemiae]|uniref:alpha/beta fold hydrolase n=1 Tax=Nocardia anaemiae TaxID=263910 RepID=UPI0007A4ED1C|nr:alpha/beta hydrolase [Nocardia anaemiae]